MLNPVKHIYLFQGFYCPSKKGQTGSYHRFLEHSNVKLYQDKCNYHALKDYTLNFPMPEASKIFWDHLYMILLVTRLYPGFKINIYPTKVVDSEIFQSENFQAPSYFTFAIKDLNNFYSNSLIKKVSTNSI